MAKKFIFIFFILLVPFVISHGNVISNVSLDFDSELKQNVIASAQKYLNTSEEPIEFDFDRELIAARFDRELEYSVSINPIDYSVFGFRDDRLLSRNQEKTLDKDARKELAQKIFDSLDKKYTSELLYGGEKRLYTGSYKYTWYRYIDDIYISGDHLEVEVDPVDGDIIAWRLSVFFYPKSQITTTPSITHEVAQKIAELKFNAQALDFNLILIVNKNKPVWVTKVKSLYPVFVGVDALTGNVLYSGSLRAELPENYDYGREVKVVESDFIKEIYGG